MKILSIVLAIVLSCLNFQLSLATTNLAELIGEYLAVIARGPSLRDSLRFDGPEDELQFELMVCRERSWTPESSNEKCINFTRVRSSQAASYPSLHLSWLRTKLPAYDTWRIVEVQDAFLGEYPYTRIVVMLNGKAAVFGYDPKHGPFGLLFILSIGGINTDDLLEQDISRGFTPSIFLNKDTP